MPKQNTITIRQPYEGDRGQLLVSIDATNLPAPAYAALEEVFEAAEDWAKSWLPNTVAPDGSQRYWWDQEIRSSSMPSRAKNALLRGSEGIHTIKDVFDWCDDGDGDVYFDRLLTLPRFGPETLTSFHRWMERQAQEHGTTIDESVAASAEE